MCTYLIFINLMMIRMIGGINKEENIITTKFPPNSEAIQPIMVPATA